MTTGAHQLTPAEELAVLQNGIAKSHADLQALPSMHHVDRGQREAHARNLRAYIEQARVRVAQLQGNGQQLARLPGQVMTPAMAMKATRKLSKTERKAKKRERRLKNMAQMAITSMAPDSPLVSAATILMDEKAAPDARTDAMHKLVDGVPFNHPSAPMVKMLAKEMMSDDDDDDEE